MSSWEVVYPSPSASGACLAVNLHSLLLKLCAEHSYPWIYHEMCKYISKIKQGCRWLMTETVMHSNPCPWSLCRESVHIGDPLSCVFTVHIPDMHCPFWLQEVRACQGENSLLQRALEETHTGIKEEEEEDKMKKSQVKSFSWWSGWLWRYIMGYRTFHLLVSGSNLS